MRVVQDKTTDYVCARETRCAVCTVRALTLDCGDVAPRRSSTAIVCCEHQADQVLLLCGLASFFVPELLCVLTRAS